MQHAQQGEGLGGGGGGGGATSGTGKQPHGGWGEEGSYITPPALESGATRQVVGPSMRSREKAFRQGGLPSSENGPHIPLSEAALSKVVCC